ncbi:Putative PD-(D/E)XK family member [Tistlia consotensis]|uniref:Putative PD-(D/E)XK family member n=1 Tax=Tistlia consotensis USBA 355 TaxID=560819 RepID=A0A1Y6C9X6_9PROT|nr:PD-(D/E)XK motif protein [Tistlia consotensis]SMF52266.1 Putative PD-(D/E)XK family member [Tistlia consotensis USBA 355]SNR83117.1 Putative PD-(D/E)XK family member [Tistlia consotensis]
MSVADLSALAWSRLREETTAASQELGIPSLALPVRTDQGPARLALGQDGQARLLLPIAPGAPFPRIVESRGLGLRDSLLTADGRAVRFIDLACREPALEDVFRALVAETLGRLQSGDRPDVAVEGAVRDFRTLLLRARPDEITLEAAIGLLGELNVLSRLLTASPGAWRAWKGPEGARHDFRAGAIAIEVKATVRGAGRTMTVSALDQLLEPPGGELFVYWLAFEPDPAGDLTVPALVHRVLQLADDVEGLASLLLGAGYDVAAGDAWLAWRFSALTAELYAVRPGFPRLVPDDFEGGSLPVGVSGFRYVVDLGAALEFRLSDGEAGELTRRIAQCL